MLFCEKCGIGIYDGANFCPQCGDPITSNSINPVSEKDLHHKDKDKNEDEHHVKVTQINVPRKNFNEIMFNISNWILGIIFLLSCAIFLNTESSSTVPIIFLLMSLLILPPVRNFAYMLVGGIKMPWYLRFVIIFSLFIYAAYESQDPADRKRNELERELEINIKSINDMQNKNFYKEYKAYGSPKIIYKCNDNIHYSIGTGYGTTYNGLIEKAKNSCNYNEVFKLIDGEE